MRENQDQRRAKPEAMSGESNNRTITNTEIIFIQPWPTNISSYVNQTLHSFDFYSRTYFFLMLIIYSFFFVFCLFFRSALTAYEGSQTRGPIGAVTAGLRQSYSNRGIRAAPATYTTAQATPDP